MRITLTITDEATNAVLWAVSDGVKEDAAVAQVRDLGKRMIELLVSDCLFKVRA